MIDYINAPHIECVATIDEQFRAQWFGFGDLGYAMSQLSIMLRADQLAKSPPYSIVISCDVKPARGEK